MPQLLVVEDDETIGATLEAALIAAGLAVTRCQTGRDALTLAADAAPDLVLLDLGLPDIDGLSVCRELRGMCPAAVIVLLTARRHQLDVVSGLESGADDYLTKPFSMVELLARVRAHLRRAAATEPGEAGNAHPIVTLGSLHFNGAARRVLVGNVEVALRTREFELLERFIRDPGIAISREDLMTDVWDNNWFGSTKTLDVHVASLRKRLRDAAAVVGFDAIRELPEIVTLRGHGYRMDLATTLT